MFAGSVEDIEQHYTVMNCPFPINSGVATLDLVQNPPRISYTVVPDNDTSAYHVTTFECRVDTLSSGASINTIVYTGSDNWYDVTGRASGYLFYISESIETIAERIGTFGNLVWLYFTAPAQVTGLAWFSYLEIILLLLIGFGIFLAVRGA